MAPPIPPPSAKQTYVVLPPNAQLHHSIGRRKELNVTFTPPPSASPTTLPYSGKAVWWYKRGHFEQKFWGAHGGLTREEMITPFLFKSL